MKILEGILQEKGSDLIGTLTSKAGFSADQAQKFLPVAGSAVVDSVQQHASKLDVKNLASDANVKTLLGGIDSGGLAAKAGIPSQLSADGLKAIMPMLLGFLGSKAGGAQGLLSMLGGLGDSGGGMLGKLGKMGKDLLGK